MNYAALVVVVALASACKDKAASEKFAIGRNLETDSRKVEAIVADLSVAKPQLVIEGVPAALEPAMREELQKSRIAPKGNVAIAATLDPKAPKATGELAITLKVLGSFAHPPKMTTVGATITGTVSHTNTTLEDLGRELGDIVVDYLAAQGLPLDIGVVPAATKPVAITVGPPSCTRHEDNTIRCWELDQGATPLPKLTGTRAIDAGNNYGVCGIRDNGRAYCIDAWNTTVALEDRDVCGVELATAISVGQSAACAVVAGGEVQCWGGGDEKFFAPCDTRKARTVTGVSGAVTLDVGFRQGCAVLADGTVTCWSLDKELTAKPLSGITNARSVVAGFEICAIVADDKVRCVRDNKARDVALPEPATQLALGDGVCALGTAGHVYCWRPNEAPVIVDKVDGVVALGGDISGMCAITRTDDVMCWGERGDDRAPAKKIRFP